MKSKITELEILISNYDINTKRNCHLNSINNLKINRKIERIRYYIVDSLDLQSNNLINKLTTIY